MPIAVCGEMAGDLQLTRLLLGHGPAQFLDAPGAPAGGQAAGADDRRGRAAADRRADAPRRRSGEARRRCSTSSTPDRRMRTASDAPIDARLPPRRRRRCSSTPTARADAGADDAFVLRDHRRRCRRPPRHPGSLGRRRRRRSARVSTSRCRSPAARSLAGYELAYETYGTLNADALATRCWSATR